MKVDQTPLEGYKVKLHVEATPDEYEDAAERGVHAFLLSAGAPIPDGMQMDDILSQIIGERGNVNDVKLDFAVNYLVPRAVQQAQVVPVCTPDFSRPDAYVLGMPLVFDVEVFPKPAFELISYDPVSISVELPKVTEKDIDAQIALMTQQATTMVKDEETGEEHPSIPAITDAWVKENIPDEDCNTVAQLRERMRKAGEAYMADQLEQKKMSLAAEQMALRLDQAVPDELVDAMAHSMLDELRQQVESQKHTMEEFLQEQHMTEEQLHDEVSTQARDMLRQGFALDAIFRHEGLELAEEDLMEALHAIAPGQEEEARASLDEAGYTFTVEETAQRLKAGKHILAQANVTVNE